MLPLRLTGSLLTLLTMACDATADAPPAEFPPVTLYDTEMRTLMSEIVDQTYEIDIAFPRGYGGDSMATYPVIYVLDAETNFGAVSYIARRLMKQGDIPPLLVVGIAYDTTYDAFYDLRARDLTPVKARLGRGGSAEFARFIAEELIPFVNENYPTKPRDRMIVGHSFGGLFGSMVLLTDPELFTRYLIVSPSYWYADDYIFDVKHDGSLANGMAAPQVYLSVGADESRRMVRGVQRMKTLLLQYNYPGLRLETDFFEDEHHRSVFPLAYTHGLRWHFAVD